MPNVKLYMRPQVVGSQGNCTRFNAGQRNFEYLIKHCKTQVKLQKRSLKTIKDCLGRVSDKQTDTCIRSCSPRESNMNMHSATQVTRCGPISGPTPSRPGAYAVCRMHARVSMCFDVLRCVSMCFDGRGGVCAWRLTVAIKQ